MCRKTGGRRGTRLLHPRAVDSVETVGGGDSVSFSMGLVGGCQLVPASIWRFASCVLACARLLRARFEVVFSHSRPLSAADLPRLQESAPEPSPGL